VLSELRDIIEKMKKEEELAQDAEMQLVGAAVSGGNVKQRKKVKKLQQIANYKHLLHVSFICVT